MSDALKRAKSYLQSVEASLRPQQEGATRTIHPGETHTILNELYRAVAAIHEHLDPPPTCAYCEVRPGEPHTSDCPRDGIYLADHR